MITREEIVSSLREQAANALALKNAKVTPAVKGSLMLVPQGFTERLIEFGVWKGTSDDSDLQEIKAVNVETLIESKASVKEVRGELKVISAPYRARIAELNELIKICNANLGIQQVKKPSKLELALDKIEQLKKELAIAEFQSLRIAN